MTNPKESKTFCSLAYSGLCIEAGGRSKPCCKYKTWDDHLDATQVPLVDLIHTPQFNLLRDELEKEVFHDGCQRCWDDEKRGLTSLRQQSNEKHRHLVDTFNPKVQVIDFGFGNTCNAACIMCESSSSSLWVEEEEKLSRIEENKFDRNPFPIINDRFSWSDEDLRDLKHIIHAQNEVLSSSEFTPFLQRLSHASKLSEKSMLISTNGSIWPTETTLNYLKQFKDLHIQISIDGFGDKNDYIRYPLKWEKIVDTTKKWKTFCEENKFKLTARCTVSILNCLYLEELVDWWNQISENKRISFGYSWYPHYLSPRLFIRELLPALEGSLSKVPQLNKILKSSNQPIPKNKQLFFDYIKWMDSNRNLSFRKTFPELNELIS